MKMGTTVSPWRYDAAARRALQSANLRLPRAISGIDGMCEAVEAALFLLMSCCLAGADDAADVFAWHDCYDEKGLSTIHAEASDSLLAVVESFVEDFDLARIFESPCGGREADWCSP